LLALQLTHSQATFDSVVFVIYFLQEVFMMFRVVFEFLPSGKMAPYPFSSILFLDRYPLDSIPSWVTLAFDGLVAIWVLWYFIEEIIQIYREGYKEYFSQFWNFVDIINLLLFFAVGYLRFLIYDGNKKLQKGAPLTAALIADLSLVANLESILYGINGLLIWLKLFKYITITNRLERMAKTIRRCAIDIITYLFVFFVWIMAFSVMGLLVFGRNFSRYATIGSAVTSSIRAMFGDYDFIGISQANKILGPIYIIVWLFCSTTILLNMLIAIICDMYSLVISEDEKDEAPSIFDRLRQAALIRLELLGFLKSQDLIDEMEKKIIAGIDKDDDGLIDEDELREFLSAEGALEVFGAKSVREVLDMFDKDKTGKLDKDEMAQLQAKLSEKKQKIAAMAAVKKQTAMLQGHSGMLNDLEIETASGSRPSTAGLTSAPYTPSLPGMVLPGMAMYAHQSPVLGVGAPVMDEKVVKNIEKIEKAQKGMTSTLDLIQTNTQVLLDMNSNMASFHKRLFEVEALLRRLDVHMRRESKFEELRKASFKDWRFEACLRAVCHPNSLLCLIYF